MGDELKLNIAPQSSTSEDTPEGFNEKDDDIESLTLRDILRSEQPPTTHTHEVGLHQQYKNHIIDFRKYLESDWKRWSVMQIKQAMVQGLRAIHLFDIKKKDYVYGKTIKNFWKKNPVPESELKYYHEKTNILITGKWVKEVIDFITDIGMDWTPDSNERYESISVKYNKLFIKIPYTSK